MNANTPVSELQHYGVLGMKWGVYRSSRAAKSNDRLRKKALDYDLKSDKFNKKSEKVHAVEDLGRSNKAAKKAANYSIKSSKLQKKAIKETNEFKKTVLEKRAATADYKSTIQKMKANQLSKTSGYGIKAMNLSIKSDKFARKAAKARMKIASNEAYIAKMNRKLNSVSPSTTAKGKDAVDKMLKQKAN